MEEDDAIRAFAALSNRSRLAVLRNLVKAGPDGMTAGDIARSLDASPSQMSFHLAALAECGLVAATRNARQIIYRIQFDRIGALMQFVLEDCCGNSAVVRRCCT